MQVSHNPWVIALNGSVSAFIVILGIYSYLERKVLIAGKLSGHLHNLNPPGHILIALSFFIVATFVVLVLFQGSYVKVICEWMIVSAIILFVLGVYV